MCAYICIHIRILTWSRSASLNPLAQRTTSTVASRNSQRRRRTSARARVKSTWYTLQ